LQKIRDQITAKARKRFEDPAVSIFDHVGVMAADLWIVLLRARLIGMMALEKVGLKTPPSHPEPPIPMKGNGRPN